MELTSAESVRALLMQAAAAKPVATAPVSRGRRVRCACRRCPQCLDDARWERIFAEKFADPNYYTRHNTHISSPLSSF